MGVVGTDWNGLELFKPTGVHQPRGMTTRRAFLGGAMTMALGPGCATSGTHQPTGAPAPTSSRADEWIRTLGLRALEGESGWFREIAVSGLQVHESGQPLRAQSSIYYLLNRFRPINYLHWLASDDTHVLCEGGPVDYFLFHPEGRAERVVLGSDLSRGQRPVVPVPAGCWKALRLHPEAEFALMVNVLSPQWTPQRVKVGAGADFLERYSGKAPWATPDGLRELIGPGWRG